MLRINSEPTRIHCNTLHNIFHNLFEATPFDSLGYIYHDEDSNYFGIQSDISLFDKLIKNKLIKKVLCRYSTTKPQHIYAEDLSSHQGCELYEALKSLEYKSVIRIAKYCNGKMEIISFFSKKDFYLSINFFLNNPAKVEGIVNNVKRRISSLVNEKNFSKISIPTMHYQCSIINQNSEKLKSQDNDLFLSTKEIPLKFNAYPLSNNEKEVIILIYYGFTLTEISEKLEVSRRSIDRRLQSIRNKLNCKSNLNILTKLIAS